MLIRKILAVFIIFFLLISVKASSVYAQGQISDFSAKILIEQNALINIRETIIYDFADKQKRGIIREIPLTKQNLEGKTFKINLKVNNVTDESGIKYNYQNNEYNNKVSIKIGKENLFLTGKHTYVIDYTVSGVLTYFSDHDEFYWNVTGNDWTIPIDKASANVRLNFLNNTDPKAACYTEKNTKESSFCQYKINSLTDIDFAATKIISPGNGLTMVVSFPKNLVAFVEPKEIVSANIKINPFVGLMLGIFFFIYYFLSPVFIVILWYLYGRDPKTGVPLRAWFEPPKDKNGNIMSPAEVGTLVDERADNKDISATIVDLAIRGFLKIKEVKKNKEYIFEKLKDYSGSKILGYEKEILDDFFKNGNTIKTSTLRESFYKTVNKVKNELYELLVTKDCFPKNPEKVRQTYLLVAVLVLITGNVLLFLALLIIGQVMPRKTLFGALSQKTALGLKSFLFSQERQLKFQADKLFLFEKLLPYAIAFNVEKEWAERFKELLTTQPNWYEGASSGDFNSLIFISSLTSATNQFSNISRAPSSTVTSSGFSSGFSGGSSGGGFGGGGGSSW